jgi:tetraacyldisaccharide-1-P 4'-kinase
VTGIATPAPFYRTLREWEADVVEVMEFPDHYAYTLADWQTIIHTSRRSDLIVTTEKDLVKLERFPFASGRLVALRAHMRIEPAGQVLAAVEQQFRYKTMDIIDHGRTLPYQGS